MEPKTYCLSNTQKNIWNVEQHFTNTNICNIVGELKFEEKIDVNILKQALNLLVKKNEALRIRMKYNKGVIEQYVEPYCQFEINVLELDDITNYVKEYTSCVFDITKDKLYYFEIVKKSDGKVTLMTRFHHIITDAWSLSLISSEIVELYYKLLNGIEIEDKDYYSYLEYLEEEKAYLESEKYIKAQNYWHEIYEIEPQILNLKPEKIKHSTKACRDIYTIPQQQSKNIRNFCKDKGITEYCLFLTTLQIYLSKKYNVDDVIIGNPFLNRKNHNERQAIGIFVNTLPVRLRVSENQKIEELLKENANIIRNCLKHEKYPYNKILEHVKNVHHINQNLYNVLFSYQNAKDNKIKEKINYSTEWVFNENIADNLEIHIHDRNDNGNYNILYDYQIDIFDSESIRKINDTFLNIISQIIENSQMRFNELKIITKQEEDYILNNINNKKLDLNNEYKYQNIYNLIFNKYKNDKIAIESKEEKIRYEELFNRVDKLVSYLKKNTNIEQNENIGIIADKNIDTIVGILAILKMNCTFVPIDPMYPNERKEYMIKTAEISTILQTKEYKDIKANRKIDINYDKYKDEKEDNGSYDYDINNNIYIIYTSGSTGKPKPVTITHKNIINLIMNEICLGELDFKENSKILQFATLSFDVSYQEIFTAFLTNSSLYIIDDNAKKDSNKLLEIIKQNNIDILFIPPRYLELLAENKLINDSKLPLRHIITAGEQLIITENIKNILDRDIIIHNHYGPAETHVATTYKLDKNNIEIKPPIGKPIQNVNVYILDKNKNLCQIDSIGEIYISGDCVGNGYFNNAEITSERFLTDPFNPDYKMYKTGDLGKMDSNGNVYYLGRTDFQVKINGYRVEIEEVEKAISSIEALNKAVVLTENDSKGKKKLIAFIQLKEEITYEELKSQMINNLPQYMIPSKFYLVDEMPLTINGKIDKRELNANKENLKLLSSNSGNVLPETIEEEKILKCMQEILGINDLNVQSDFFEMGGDSLLAIALQVELAKEDIILNTQEIYDYSTPRYIAKYLKEKSNIKNNSKFEKIVMPQKEVKLKDKNNILLTGATGFLGIHVLHSLINNTNNNIYCLTRNKKDLKAEYRIKANYKSYFNEDVEPYINKRVFVIEGDLTNERFGLDENEYIKLQNQIDIVINVAASVKHYGNREYNFEHNVVSLKRIVEFAKENDILVNHISTVGIAGNNLVDTQDCYKNTFSEEDLIIGQKYYDNVYLSTKLQAEKFLIDSILDGIINANILRIGNLMNRYGDNKFQLNKETNAFQNKIKEIIKIGYAPKSIEHFSFDITPVDMCADAVVKLCLNNQYNNVYHVLNNHEIKMDDIKNILTNLGIKIDFREDFDKEILESSKWIINDLTLKNKEKINIDSNKTVKVLEDLGFKWKNDQEYYLRVMKSIVEEENNDE